MSFKTAVEVLSLLDDASVDGAKVVDAMKKSGIKNATWTKIEGPKGHTDFVKGVLQGRNGKSQGGKAPTLGIVGRLGGVGARPEVLGFVSDGDGAATALTAALKLGSMSQKGDVLEGDVIVATHICPFAPTAPHDPVPFMGSPVDMGVMNEHEIDPEMDAVLSLDTTKGNRVINHRGFALSPTVKEGWILKVSDDLLDIMSIVTGCLPVTFPVTMQDITPYGEDIYHINSIMQPSTATQAPVVGLAITTCTAVPGCATGASHILDIDGAARFVIEVAKAFGANKCSFYDREEFQKLVRLYGPMTHLQKRQTT